MISIFILLILNFLFACYIHFGNPFRARLMINTVGGFSKTRNWQGWEISSDFVKNKCHKVCRSQFRLHFQLFWHMITLWFMLFLELLIFPGKAKIEKMSRDLKVKYEYLESAMNLVLQISFIIIFTISWWPVSLSKSSLCQRLRWSVAGQVVRALTILTSCPWFESLWGRVGGLIKKI